MQTNASKLKSLGDNGHIGRAPVETGYKTVIDRRNASIVKRDNKDGRFIEYDYHERNIPTKADTIFHKSRELAGDAMAYLRFIRKSGASDIELMASLLGKNPNGSTPEFNHPALMDLRHIVETEANVCIICQGFLRSATESNVEQLIQSERLRSVHVKKRSVKLMHEQVTIKRFKRGELKSELVSVLERNNFRRERQVGSVRTKDFGYIYRVHVPIRKDLSYALYSTIGYGRRYQKLLERIIYHRDDLDLPENERRIHRIKKTPVYEYTNGLVSGGKEISYQKCKC